MRFSILIVLACSALLACQISRAQGCGSQPWINAFHPEKPVVAEKTDVCPPDLKLPLFTREGTLACPTENMYDVAFNSMMTGWHYTPTAGVKSPHGERTGARVSPATFGCSIHHDGDPAKSTGELYGRVRTSLGWVRINNLRN